VRFLIYKCSECGQALTIRAKFDNIITCELTNNMLFRRDIKTDIVDVDVICKNNPSHVLEIDMYNEIVHIFRKYYATMVGPDWEGLYTSLVDDAGVAFRKNGPR